MIDCGTNKDAYSLLKALHDMDLTLKDIHYLLLTHHHSDHVGLVPFLVKENPEIRIIMSNKCAEILKTGAHHKEDNEKYSSVLLKLTVGPYLKLSKKIKDTFEAYETRAKDILIDSDDGLTLTKIGLEGKILFTPGHTADSISAIIDDVAFVGDALRNMLNHAGAAYRPLISYDAQECEQSIQKIIDTGAQVICPAHGQPFEAEKIKIKPEK